MKILNLTQHKATVDQIDAGVVDLTGSAAEYIKTVLTFESIPSSGELSNRAHELARTAYDLGYTRAMIGGAPFFMSMLEKKLKDKGILPLYAFSTRVSAEITLDGVTTKTSSFKHVGFVDPTTGMSYGGSL
jgi:hypothetical protein